MLFCSLNISRVIPVIIVLIFLFRIVCRWKIFRKMGTRPWLSLIPGVREFFIFKRCARIAPFLILCGIAVLLILAAVVPGYIDFYLPLPSYIRDRMIPFAIVCLMVIVILMYKRLAFAFGHDIGYFMGLVFLNPIFLGILAFSKKKAFHPELAVIRGKEMREYSAQNRTLRTKIMSAVSAVILIATSVGYMGYVVMKEVQPAPLVRHVLSQTYDATEGKVSGMGHVVYPALEQGTVSDNSVRDLYFPDKSEVQDVTVYMYLIGSDLEDASGSASINLRQIIDATKAGSDLKFIIEAGGTGRWFTNGFQNRRTGRYMIKDGEVTRLETLPRDTSMSEEKTLKEFLKWANKNYPSDRKMLFFWDHGGAISGFGIDELNPAKGKNLLSIAAIKNSLKASGEKYDLIAFDACLMQTLEVCHALEPFADYMLASEESEPGSGLYYTAAFGRLAGEPDLDTLKFGAMMCSSYDQALELLKGEPQIGSTLSMTDLRYIPVVEETFMGYLSGLDRKFMSDTSSFIQMSNARSKSYEFKMDDQIDLIDFLEVSDISSDRKTEMIGKIKKAVAVRNAASANHINGLAVYMPYDDIPSYSSIYENMKKLKLETEEKVYNDFASILASQKETKNQTVDPELSALNLEAEEWYNDKFKDYNTSMYLQDVPIVREGNRYEIEVPEEEQNIITDCRFGLKMKVGGRYADLGSVNVFSTESSGHYVMDFDNTWVAINNVLVAVHPGTPKLMEDGKVLYTGTVDATLNFVAPITIYIEWRDSGGNAGEGTILGYLPADEDSDDVAEYGMPRGFKQFKENNVVTFLYDWYDEEGNYLSTAMGHLPIHVGPDGMRVSTRDISSEVYECYGILEDAMLRTMQTKNVHHEAEE